MGGPRIERVDVAAYRIPTDAPESDGTCAWTSTTLVLVELHGGGRVGLGYTYAAAAAGQVIAELLAPVVTGTDPFAHAATWADLWRAVRNQGAPGICAAAISAVDVALWDLAAKHAGRSLVEVLGGAGRAVPAYGSGGFTSYDDDQLRRQLAGWVAAGLRRVKIKVGRDPADDPRRVAVARRTLGPDVALFVDANGALRPPAALDLALRFAAQGVLWFEEPVSSDDPAGLRLVRQRAPAGMQIAAGEYAYTPFEFRRLLEADAVDVLQADLTRCGGITGFLRAAALCAAWSRPLSAHCAPALHAPACAALPEVVHLEYFHDHVRIEDALFEGTPALVGGALLPDRSRPGLGLEFRRADAARYAV